MLHAAAPPVERLPAQALRGRRQDAGGPASRAAAAAAADHQNVVRVAARVVKGGRKPVELAIVRKDHSRDPYARPGQRVPDPAGAADMRIQAVKAV